MDNKIKELIRIIDTSNNIVFFGGAGVSTLSGIKDFRGKNGLYKEKSDYSPEYLLSSKYFYENTQLFYEYYKKNMNTLDKKPNIVHTYLTKLEKENKLKAIITQNIDGLHQEAGSKNVLELHGSIKRNYCTKCNKFYSADYVFNGVGIPYCECKGIIKPDVVLYGEALPNAFDEAINYITNADTLIVAGTSLTVEPASSLVRIFSGKNLVIINNDPTAYDNLATLLIHDDLKNVFENLK